MTGGMAYEALNNIGHFASARHHRAQRQRPQLRADDLQPHRRADAASIGPMADASQPASAHHRAAVAEPHQHPPQPGLRAPPAQARSGSCASCPRRAAGREGRRGVQGGRARVPPAAVVLRGARRPLRRPGRRPRHRGAWSARCATPSSCRPTDRSSCTSSPQKGRGYPPAEDDDEKHLHDAPVFDPAIGPPKAVPTGYTQAFAEAMIKEAEADPRLVAITAAMAGPTGLIPFQARFPERFFDVGIAEQHAVTGAAGMAMGGLRPVVAIYSTFLNRAWDQVVYDVALHRLPVVFCLDRAGITGDNGPSHHGVYDLALLAKVPGMRVLAPSSAQELQVMLHDALELMARGAGGDPLPERHGAARSASTRSASGCNARQLPRGDGSVCILAIGKLVTFARQAVRSLGERGVDATLWDVRSCAPLDQTMISDAAAHGSW